MLHYQGKLMVAKTFQQNLTKIHKYLKWLMFKAHICYDNQKSEMIP